MEKSAYDQEQPMSERDCQKLYILIFRKIRESLAGLYGGYKSKSNISLFEKQIKALLKINQ